MGLDSEDQQHHPLGTLPPLDSQPPDVQLDTHFLSNNIVSLNYPQSPIMLPAYTVAPPPMFNPHASPYGPTQVPSLTNSQGVPPPSLNFSNGMPPPHSPSFSQGVPLHYSQGIPPSPSFSQVLPSPRSPTFSQGMQLPSPRSPTFSQGMPLTYSQGIPLLSLNVSQSVPPPPSPTALSPNELRLSSRVMPPPLIISDSNNTQPSPRSPTFAAPQSPTFLHLSQSFGAFQTPPQSPTSVNLNAALAFSGGIEGPNGQNIPSAVLGSAALMRNIHFARRNDIPIRWVRVLDVTIHGARQLATKKKDGTNDAKCKLAVEGVTKITKTCKKTVDPSWEESFKFPLHELCNLTFTIYNHNMIMTDDELCTCTIPSSQLIEGNKVSNWFPMQPNGEIDLTIGLSPPRPDSFKFVVHKNSYLGEWNYRIQDSNGAKVFTITNEQNVAYMRDKQGAELLHIKTSHFPRKSYELFEPNQASASATLTSKVGLGVGDDFQLHLNKGNANVQVKGDGLGKVRYMFVDAKNRNVAFIQAPPRATSAIIEIAADQDIPMFLVCGAILGCSTS